MSDLPPGGGRRRRRRYRGGESSRRKEEEGRKSRCQERGGGRGRRGERGGSLRRRTRRILLLSLSLSLTLLAKAVVGGAGGAGGVVEAFASRTPPPTSGGLVRARHRGRGSGLHLGVLPKTAALFLKPAGRTTAASSTASSFASALSSSSPSVLRPLPRGAATSRAASSSAFSSVTTRLAASSSSPWLPSWLPSKQFDDDDNDALLGRTEEEGTKEEEEKLEDVPDIKDVDDLVAEAAHECLEEEEENVLTEASAVAPDDGDGEAYDGSAEVVPAVAIDNGGDDVGDEEEIADDSNDPVRRARRDSMEVRSMAARAKEEKVRRKVAEGLKKNKNRRFVTTKEIVDIDDEYDERNQDEEEVALPLRMERESSSNDVPSSSSSPPPRSGANAATTTYENYDATLVRTDLTANVNRFYRIRVVRSPAVADAMDAVTDAAGGDKDAVRPAAKEGGGQVSLPSSSQEAAAAETEVDARTRSEEATEEKEKEEGERTYSLMTQWGRIGEPCSSSATAERSFPSEDEAVVAFCEKFREKTGTEWDDYLDRFEEGWTGGVGGRAEAGAEEEEGRRFYVPVELLREDGDGSEDDDADRDGYEGKAEKTPSSSSSQFPLGRLSRAQLLRGMSALDRLEAALAGEEEDAPSQQASTAAAATISDLSSDFYMAVPRSFGRASPPIIDTPQAVLAKRAALRRELDLLLPEEETTMEEDDDDRKDKGEGEDDEAVASVVSDSDDDSTSSEFFFASNEADAAAVAAGAGTTAKKGPQEEEHDDEGGVWSDPESFFDAGATLGDAVAAFGGGADGENLSVKSEDEDGNGATATTPTTASTIGEAMKAMREDGGGRYVEAKMPSSVSATASSFLPKTTVESLAEYENVDAAVVEGDQGEVAAKEDGGSGGETEAQEEEVGSPFARAPEQSLRPEEDDGTPPREGRGPSSIAAGAKAMTVLTSDAVRKRANATTPSSSSSSSANAVRAEKDEIARRTRLLSQLSERRSEHHGEEDQVDEIVKRAFERATSTSFPSSAAADKPPLAERDQRSTTVRLEGFLPPTNATFFTTAVAKEADLVRKWAEQAKEERREKTRRTRRGRGGLGGGGGGPRRAFASAEEVRSRRGKSSAVAAATPTAATVLEPVKKKKNNAAQPLAGASVGTNLWDLLAQKAVNEKRKELRAAAVAAAKKEELDLRRDEDEGDGEAVTASGEEKGAGGEKVAMSAHRSDNDNDEEETEDDDDDLDGDGKGHGYSNEDDTMFAVAASTRRSAPTVKEVTSFLRRRSVLAAAVAVVIARRMLCVWVGRMLV